ncbi:PRC-barrel domain protein [compost metagenome]
MRKATDLIGMPVIAIDTGKQVGQVKDVCMDEYWNLHGIILEVKHWFTPSRFIAWSDLTACGDDVVTIQDESAIHELQDDAQLFALIGGKQRLKGLPVITESGQQLGMVEDVYLESNMGRQIVGYEISEGFISDLKEGRKWLPMPEKVTIGEDAVIVPIHCIEEVDELFVSREE